ncbi:uncharacterized protein LOC132938784 [Metopolophium dirhodum]|uniref:uncharacterized protein LOC132938784 n=1 Tax=Metopolophium dirhodum TaxID=44670 RepID=UPI00298F4B5E|nr:uncharacterized protein LOC132938784 [Metopolophium dirhodum]
MSTSTNETLDTNEALKQILDTVNELKSTQNKIIASINSCRESNKTQEKTEVISENKTLKAKIEPIEGKITTLETAASPGTNVESVYSELMDRQSRLTDTLTVDEILKSIDLQINPVSVRRLGKQSNKPRPLLTTLPNSSDVFEVLKVKRKLLSTANFKDIRIASDRTTQQRQYFTNIVSQLKQRSDTALLNYDLIILTETWLSRSVNDSELGLCPHYTVFRCDRYEIHGPDIRGGGVLIAIKVQYPCHRLIIQQDLVEQLFVKIHINHISLIVGSVYFPPRSDLNLYNSHVNVIDNLMSKYYNDRFLVLGDYNLTNVNWVSNNRKIIPRLSNNNLYESNIISALSYVNLMQNNLIHNSSGSLLDLVFSNIVNVNVSLETSPLVPLDYKFHPALKIPLPLSSTKNNLYYNEIVHDFISCDYNAIRSCMASTDWSCTFKDLHINEALDIFYSRLHDIIDVHCQKKRMFFLKYPLWFSKTLKQLIFSKKVAHKVYKQTPTNVNYNIFSNLRAKCKVVNKTDYGNFIQRTQSSIVSNPKRFWNYIYSKRSNSNIPSVISYSNQTVTGGDKIAESFANYYSTIYKQLNFMQKPPDDIKSMKVDLNTCVITLSDIYDELSNLKSTTCPGPDNIPYAFFTNYSNKEFISFADDTAILISEPTIENLYHEANNILNEIIDLDGMVM